MVDVLYDEAKNILDEDINFCKQIGIHGSQLIEKLSNILYTKILFFRFFFKKK